MKTATKIGAKPFTFLYSVLYPACAMFTAIVLGAFTLSHFLGFNVNISRNIETKIQNFETNELKIEYLYPDKLGIPTMLLIGLFLFCLALFTISYVHKMEFSKLSARLLHFGGTLLAFFLFFLSLSGYIADAASSFSTVMLSLTLVGILYFICLAIKTALSRPIRFISRRFGTVISRYIAPVIAICAFLILICAILGLVLKTNMAVDITTKFDPNNDKIRYETTTTVITPLAPTLNNYLRYLGTGAVIVAAIALMFTKLSKAAKGLLNFAVCSAGFFLIWFIQMDFFYELDNMLLYSIIAYLSAYIVIFTASCVIAHMLRRTREGNEDYQSQFSVKTKKR